MFGQRQVGAHYKGGCRADGKVGGGGIITWNYLSSVSQWQLQKGPGKPTNRLREWQVWEASIVLRALHPRSQPGKKELDPPALRRQPSPSQEGGPDSGRKDTWRLWHWRPGCLLPVKNHQNWVATCFWHSCDHFKDTISPLQSSGYQLKYHKRRAGRGLNCKVGKASFLGGRSCLSLSCFLSSLPPNVLGSACDMERSWQVLPWLCLIDALRCCSGLWCWCGCLVLQRAPLCF